MKAEIMTITPAIAESMLKKNTRNRSVSPTSLRKYVNAMKAGNWKSNGDAIRFDKQGALIDGQHRLMAIVNTRTTHEMVVISGLEPEVFDTIDNGYGRNNVHTCEVGGIPNAPRVAPAICVLAQYDGPGIFKHFRMEIPTFEIHKYLALYPELPQAIDEIGPAKPKIITRSVFDACYYIFRRLDKEMALEYMVAMRDGIGVETLAGWHQLRERMLQNRVAVKKIPTGHLMAVLIKGWNMARNGKDHKITWSAEKEGFPLAF